MRIVTLKLVKNKLGHDDENINMLNAAAGEIDM